MQIKTHFTSKNHSNNQLFWKGGMKIMRKVKSEIRVSMAGKRTECK